MVVVNKMPKKYDSCIKQVKQKIKSGKLKKTYKCDTKGNPNKRGKKRCLSNPFKLCSRVKR